MGKASRKLNKKKQKETIQNQQDAGSKLRDLMAEQQEKMEYARAIETLAELVEKNLVTAADMYDGARDYYMLGDYTRAGQCVNTVLSMEPNHIGARILLGKLCLNEERIDDALSIYDFVLENFRQQLTQDQADEILESLRYYGRHEAEKLRSDYAACYDFFVQQTGESQQDISSPEAESDDAVAQEKQAIQAQNCSLIEQVSLLNRFAGAHFYKSDYAGAKELLTAALEIDSHNDMSLRNLALLLAAMGEQEKAFEAAAQMQVVDFVLLQQLKR